MASHHIAIRPRSLDTVLADLKHARRDWEDALAAKDADAQDRASEAETRLDDLREEFDALLLRATGLTVEALMQARQECLL